MAGIFCDLPIFLKRTRKKEVIHTKYNTVVSILQFEKHCNILFFGLAERKTVLQKT